MNNFGNVHLNQMLVRSSFLSVDIVMEYLFEAKLKRKQECNCTTIIYVQVWGRWRMNWIICKLLWIIWKGRMMIYMPSWQNCCNLIVKLGNSFKNHCKLNSNSQSHDHFVLREPYNLLICCPKISKYYYLLSCEWIVSYICKKWTTFNHLFWSNYICDWA